MGLNPAILRNHISHEQTAWPLLHRSLLRGGGELEQGWVPSCPEATVRLGGLRVNRQARFKGLGPFRARSLDLRSCPLTFKLCQCVVCLVPDQGFRGSALRRTQLIGDTPVQTLRVQVLPREGPCLAIVWSGHLRAVFLWAEPGAQRPSGGGFLTYSGLGLQVM